MGACLASVVCAIWVWVTHFGDGECWAPLSIWLVEFFALRQRAFSIFAIWVFEAFAPLQGGGGANVGALIIRI